MRTQTIALAGSAPGTALTLTIQRFGNADARPRAYIQAALHADEVPGMLTAHHLRERLTALEAEGAIRGEVVLVPTANPVGLGQAVLGDAIGRFSLADGANFNRGFPHLTAAVAGQVEGRLGQDPEANARLIRDALAAAIEASPATTPVQHLKKALLGLAASADIVLDLHCDSEAVVHLYTLTPMADAFAPLAALLGAEAVLLATESGDDPFDEAVSRPWHELSETFPEASIPLGCVSATVELRGQGDVSHHAATADAEAILAFLVLRGVLGGDAPAVPQARYRPTPLAASEPVVATISGIVAFHRAVGERVAEGDRIADLVDPITGAITPVLAPTDGLLFARTSARFAVAGRRLGKVAGTTARRSGKLLSP